MAGGIIEAAEGDLISAEDSFLSRFEGNPPAAESQIHALEVAEALKLPDDYVEFLKKRNGGSGFVGESFVRLFPVETVLQENSEFRKARYAPGALFIGSDGGEELFAYDTRKLPMRIVLIHRTGAGWDGAVPLGGNLSEFFRKLFIGDLYSGL
jgi:hypothetical protein